MSTDIYGFIEVVHPPASHPSYEGEPWSPCMELCPLYADSDYLAFGCLFGVRNWIGWEPVAADRGLPAGVSTAVRADYDDIARADSAVHGSTWVS
ncbi:hypothetical protein [Micromonospora rhizosphaerae]|uniref:hypothetical protein n=1 Tax=Micromonospora rhizosphaerae TaxID=568872 RepID=UPI00114CC4DF|nr:hypothetical protein [Micromonospora rhizosphaerae]